MERDPEGMSGRHDVERHAGHGVPVRVRRRDRAGLKYGDALTAGAPIATGVVEGTCRHLICDRLEITGARWTVATAEAVLKLRALASNDNFDDYWRFHESAEYRRNHLAPYSNATLPVLSPPRRARHPKVVK